MCFGLPEIFSRAFFAFHDVAHVAVSHNRICKRQKRDCRKKTKALYTVMLSSGITNSSD